MNFHSFFKQLMPYLMLGMSIALFIGILFILLQVIFYGVIVGLVLYGAHLIKTKFFGPKQQLNSSGHIIDHNSID